jgi:tRNA (adenine22-N1)-methyltransferase
LKLGKRLKALDQLIENSYQHIWDCCCDHGYLGRALLARSEGQHVHFVDCIEKITDRLSQKLLDHDNQKKSKSLSTWQVHAMDVLDLPLHDYEQKAAHLIIIAGVGGELTLKMVKHLWHKHSSLNIHFLLCPVHHQYELRSGLQMTSLKVLDEVLVVENNRFYEIMLLAKNSDNGQPLTAVGSQLWHVRESEQLSKAYQYSLMEQYLVQTIAHYQRSLNMHAKHSGEFRKIAAIIKQYRTVEHALANERV